MAKVIVQIIVVGTQIVGKAFVEAYKQAVANAAAGGSATSRMGKDSLSRRTGMSLDEAYQILNLKRDVSNLSKNYEHLFKVNDATSGGSFYLQSKVVRAKERIDMELAEAKKESQKPQDINEQSSSQSASSNS
ncbi:11379_t:CDS:2 [Funneliformis mosseae]|uniref:Mitochondrial import inner membrane translocase subunit TIM16 n=1 Tax=Funneliformis mosseae TaxID=27381 RepID=A0A9N9N873_FUNMO|nr:11379_t:CDS:2 [Funneliformis mosseae]